MAADPPCNRREIPLHGVESHWLAPDGTAIRRFDWAPAGTPPRGRLLFLPGRGDFYEKYLEAMGHWQARGWAVTALDWRGQALSGRLGHDPLTGHIADFAIWVADLADLDAALRALALELDHGLLNEKPGLESPTLEHICQYFADHLKPRFLGLSRIVVSRPSIGESCALTL